MNTTVVNSVEDLNTRYFQNISDELENEIRNNGTCVEQNWCYNQYPGSWTYKLKDETFIEIRFADKNGFSTEGIKL